MSSSGEMSVGPVLFDMHGGVSQKSRIWGDFQVALCRSQKSCEVAVSSNRQKVTIEERHNANVVILLEIIEQIGN
mgnify:CR=1 FL=1